ncbi:MAG TPA: prepilin-type N-terminal cleavage/methylation domain-containing protein [Candidatus Acidoferrum sp.]|nr:prepilin-type N-terminal cleavage/methylation domain-containing protein [Candidatus Acidoferrum sp.]
MNRNSAQRARSPKALRRVEHGFSLIELLVVVAIILIIAAIAVPNLMKSKMSANEAGAAESVRTIVTGETTYSSACPDIGYSATLQELNTGAICASGKNIIDDVLGASDPSFKSGYTFTYTFSTTGGPMNTGFTIVAAPSAQGYTGNRAFSSDQTGVIRYTLNGSAPTPTSSALQ